MAGQISLCQATFAGIGAFTTAQLVDALGSAGAARDGRRRGRRRGGRRAARDPGAAARRHLPRRSRRFAFALMFDNVHRAVRLGRRRRARRCACPRPVIGPFDFVERQDVLRALPDRARASSASLVILVRRGHDRARTSTRCAAARRRARRSASTRSRAQIVAFALSAGDRRARRRAARRCTTGRRELDRELRVRSTGFVWVVLVVSPRLAHGRGRDPSRVGFGVRRCRARRSLAREHVQLGVLHAQPP